MVIAILCEDVGMRGRYQRAGGLPPASNPPGGRLQRLMLQPTHADRVEEAKRKRRHVLELHLLGRDPPPAAAPPGRRTPGRAIKAARGAPPLAGGGLTRPSSAAGGSAAAAAKPPPLPSPFASQSPPEQPSRPASLRRMKSRRKKWQERIIFPFSAIEYRSILNNFEDVDTDGNGCLDWSEVCGIGTSLGGKVIDYQDFKKMDSDGSGSVEFLELLRVLYPNTPVATLKLAVRKWGSPHACREGYGGDWHEVLSEEQRDELVAIYHLYTAGGTVPLTYDSLRRAVGTAAISHEELQRICADHDTDGDGVLSLDDFATLMDAVFGRSVKAHPLKLFFQSR
ncbi:Caltractin [Diplonema papillatum]|nr:Caltractin [Diplonema papillatum]